MHLRCAYQGLQHLSGCLTLTGAVKQDGAVDGSFLRAEQSRHFFAVLPGCRHIGLQQVQGKAPGPQLRACRLFGNGRINVLQAALKIMKALFNQTPQK